MIDKFHISCRVRPNKGIDVTPSEQADTLIPTTTPTAALAIWLTGINHEGSWLRCSTDDLSRLLACAKNDRWCDFEVSGFNDWNVHSWERDDNTITMGGSACCGDFEYEVKVTPA